LRVSASWKGEGATPTRCGERTDRPMAALTKRMTISSLRERLWPKSAQQREQHILGYLFLLPDLIGLGVFWIAPMIFLFYLSLHEWTGLSAATRIGFENYVELMHDELWWKSLRVTLVYLAAFVPLVVIVPLALAVLLNMQIRGRNWFRTGFFVPFAIPMVIAAVAWAFMLDPGFGVVNYILRGILHLPLIRELGWKLPGQMWLASRTQALPVVILVGIWKFVGFYMIIFLAGLQDIPTEYYEAAMIDGASTWRLFRDITVPLLRPVIMFVLLIAAFRAFQVFDQVYVMTSGGPFYATYTVMYFIYLKGFRFFRFGYAAAASVVLFAMILVFTLAQIRYVGLGEAE
jgi:multiple sugar transport system permease protein